MRITPSIIEFSQSVSSRIQIKLDRELPKVNPAVERGYVFVSEPSVIYDFNPDLNGFSGFTIRFTVRATNDNTFGLVIPAILRAETEISSVKGWESSIMVEEDDIERVGDTVFLRVNISAAASKGYLASARTINVDPAELFSKDALDEARLDPKTGMMEVTCDMLLQDFTEHEGDADTSDGWIRDGQCGTLRNLVDVSNVVNNYIEDSYGDSLVHGVNPPYSYVEATSVSDREVSATLVVDNIGSVLKLSDVAITTKHLLRVYGFTDIYTTVPGVNGSAISFSVQAITESEDAAATGGVNDDPPAKDPAMTSDPTAFSVQELVDDIVTLWDGYYLDSSIRASLVDHVLSVTVPAGEHTPRLVAHVGSILGDYGCDDLYFSARVYPDHEATVIVTIHHSNLLSETELSGRADGRSGINT